MLIRNAYTAQTIDLCRMHYDETETTEAELGFSLGPVVDSRDRGCRLCEIEGPEVNNERKQMGITS
jgi:hypothetical protein